MAAEDRVVLELLATHASLTSGNKTLVLGQKVYATGITGALSNPIKIGDGATAYTSLKWQEFKLLKTIDLTSANVTYTLPKIIGGNQVVDIYWTAGGTYKMTLAVTNSETVGGIAAAIWLGEGTGHAVIVSDGTNWQVREYEDLIIDATKGIARKEADGTMFCSNSKLYASENISTVWGDIFLSSSLTLSDYAKAFVSISSSDTNVTLGSASCFSSKAGLKALDQWQDSYAVRGAAVTGQPLEISGTATGRWRT